MTNNKDTKRAALYVRVSTEEQKQHGISIESQEHALRQYCTDNGYTICGIYNDAGISARKKYTRRPALLRLLEDCRSGDVDIILFTKLDRWFRSVADYYEVQKVLDECHVPWKTIWEDYTTEDANGVFKVNIMLSVNQQEADRTSERIKAVMAYKRTKGEVISGNMPLGYTLENKKPVKDPNTRDGVDAFWKTYLMGKGMKASRQAASQHNVHISTSTGSFLLRNAMNYTGTIQCVPCEPYITLDDANRILSTRRPKQRIAEYTYLFRGFIVCGECGKFLGGHRSKTQVWYNCHAHYSDKGCPNKANMSESAIERYLIEHYNDDLNKYTMELKARVDGYDVSKHEKYIRSLEDKVSKLVDLYLDGIIEKEEYIKRRTALVQAIEDEKKEIESVPQMPSVSTLPDGWLNIYNDLDNEHKRAFWMRILKSISVDSDRTMHINY